MCKRFTAVEKKESDKRNNITIKKGIIGNDNTGNTFGLTVTKKGTIYLKKDSEIK